MFVCDGMQHNPIVRKNITIRVTYPDRHVVRGAVPCLPCLAAVYAWERTAA